VSIADIRNFRRVNDDTLTGGQPTEDQLRSAAADGVQVVVNLATINPRYSLADEGGLVDSLGLAYHHIPVDWERPKAADYDEFVRVMQASAGKRVLIHCAANYRVTAFYGLYAMQHLGWSRAQADALRAAVWERQFPIWDEFVQNMQTRIEAGQP
jgi:protein tyrosine phosphatase (PTP) superfamily phosphohydrolase (DUF442 family)